MGDDSTDQDSSGWFTRRKVGIGLLALLGIGAIGDSLEEDEEDENGTVTAEDNDGDSEDDGEEDGEGVDGNEWAASLDNITEAEVFGYSEQDVGGGEVQAFMDIETTSFAPLNAAALFGLYR